MANDWLHSNAIAYSAEDGSLLLSVRHQDWLVNIDYQDSASFLAPGQNLLYDNANTRCVRFDVCESRGQVYSLDAGRMLATLATNVGLGRYSYALGSAQRLSNGNYHFNSGVAGLISDPLAVAQEVLAGGSSNYALAVPVLVHRSFRIRSLYTTP